MTAPFVVAGGIVRNRAWILPDHLHAVAFNKPAQMFYLTGDNTDETAEILRFGMLFNGESQGSRSVLTDGVEKETWMGTPIASVLHDTGFPGYTRDGSDGPRYDSRHMAAERNLWADEALKRWPQATHLWVVDSDVLPSPGVLERLLALETLVAGAFVPIADGMTPIHMMGWRVRPRRTGEEKLLTKPHVVSLVGGCYLIRREVAEWPLTRPLWGPDAQGEDGYFARKMRQNGIVMMVDPLARCRHEMSQR